MSREIKFRVRNLNTGRVIGYETVSDGMWFISAKGQDWENGTYSPAEGVKLQREQYTGLIDKNGVEIYGGDVVREFVKDGEYHKLRMHDKPALVHWDREYAAFELVTKSNYYPIEQLPMTQEWLGEALYGADLQHVKLVVIGSVYENPELLK